MALWAAGHLDDPDATAATGWAREHRDQWLGGYRGVLGFAFLLRRQG